MGTWAIDKYKIRNPQLRKILEDIFEGLTEVDMKFDDFKLDNATPVNAVASQGKLTVDTQPTVGDTLTIGTKTYTVVTDETAASDGEVDAGADLADFKTLLVAAINGTDGINTAHTQVTAAAFSGDDCVITASTKGISGDSIATTETFTEGTNVFDGTTLGTTTAGVDGTVGSQWECKVDSGCIYVCTADNTVSGANWGKATLTVGY